MATVVNTIQALVLISSSSATSKEARTTRVIIQKALLKKTTDKETKKELTQLSNYISSRDLTFCCAGYYSRRRRSGFSYVGFVLDDDTCRWVYSGISRFPHSFIPVLLYTHHASPSSAIKTSTLRAGQMLLLDSNSRTYIRNEAATELKGRWTRRFPRKHADQRHCPARFPQANVRKRHRKGIQSGSPQ
ncbi:hypothetical protein PR048_032357 [Dryococelus australis]|uniref:Uncharacterized protein n=1 Tax=Dryococelus australis TaxID=614101 RepID=A0ABQ9G1Z7_9NEOP|nr:hypothetical protein PR048_032357 [Dryococelus australis]